MIHGPAPRALLSLIRRTAAALLPLAAVAAFAFVGSPIARAQTTGFNGGTGANDFVFHVAEQSDGRILIGGRFTTYNGVPRSGLARLNADGSLDPSFDPGTGTVGSVYYIAEQPNGQIYITGDFSSYDGIPCAGVLRLNADGSPDYGFNPNTAAYGSVVYSLAVQVDGKVIVGGRFLTFNGAALAGVARLNTDGTVDTTFNPGSGVTGSAAVGLNGVYDVVLQPDGRVLLAGLFNRYNNVLQPGIVRVNTDGSLDTSFVVGDGVAKGNTAQAVALQSDGKIIVVGNFTRFSDAAAGGIVRLNTDGSIDTTFNAGAGASGRSDVVYSAAVQTDGKVVVGGDFATFNGVTANGIVRLNADGSVDTTFNTNGGADNAYVYDVALQTDGGVLLGGNFITVGGFSSPGVARLATNGSNESEDVVTISTNPVKIGQNASSTVATVTLTRTGNLTQPLTVDYTTGGAAVSGVDYLPLSGHKTFKANSASASFSVTAKAQADAAYAVVPLKIVLAANPGYLVGSVPPFVKIKIVR